MQIDKRLWGAAFALAMMVTAGTARAQYSGTGIEVTDSQASDATIANFNALVGTGANEVTFSASGLNFSSFGNITNTGDGSTDYTIGSWLGSLGSVIGSPTYSGTVNAGDTQDDTLYEFTGTAYFVNGQVYTIAHDDGVEIQIGGASNFDFVDSGPTSPTATPITYTGATGNQSFIFAYGECCGAPAVFETTLVPAATVPEPASIVLLGSLLLGVGTALRRKRA